MGCTEKLVAALRAAGAPPALIARAERNEFHDFKSQSATPCIDLAQALAEAMLADMGNAALERVRKDAMDGAFDASKEESDEWAASPEGRATIAELGGAFGSGKSKTSPEPQPGKPMPPFLDMHRLPEDERIKQICAALATGAKVGVVVDAEPGKAERYLSKIRAGYPGTRVISRSPGPVKGCVQLILQGQKVGDN